MALMDKLMDGARKHVAKTKEKHKSEGRDKNTQGKDVHHFEVHPAKGGHMLEVHHHDMGRPPEKSVHKSMSGVHKAMKEQCPCGGCTQEGAENETPGDNLGEE